MNTSTKSRRSMIGIRASAGSGKTYRLTVEYLRCFFDGADPDTILATTFTRTAASEILGRVLRRMAEAALSDDKLRALAADLDMKIDRAAAHHHLKRFCHSLERVSIGTIDSFFGAIASCYRYETGLALGSAISDESGAAARRIRREALRRVLASHDRTAILSTIDRLHGGTPGRSVVNSIDNTLCDLLSLYETTDSLHWESGTMPPNLTDAELSSAVDNLAAVKCPHTHKKFIAGMVNAREIAKSGDWASFMKCGIVKKIIEGETVFQGKEITDEILDAFQPLIAEASRGPLADHHEKTRATYRLLHALSPEYNELRRAQGMAFFSDVPLALTKLMEATTDDDISYRLNRRIDHLLLDEFQDTDPQQSRVLSPFTDRISQAAGSYSSVFWVGDVKQAIYGWRGARSEIFAQLEKKYPDIAWEELKKSYRSSQVVLDAVNTVFVNLQERGIYVRLARRSCSGGRIVVHRVRRARGKR